MSLSCFGKLVCVCDKLQRKIRQELDYECPVFILNMIFLDESGAGWDSMR